MLNTNAYLTALKNTGVTFFTGVPDSLLKEICSCITANVEPESHIIASNEGAAVGLSIGHYVGTSKLPLVYFQNSGLGNIINPLLSLASPEVYGIPILLMIGWRGEPGHNDEPQHIHQGRAMFSMLDAMDIPFVILSQKFNEASEQTKLAAQKARDTQGPVAIIVRKNTFSEYKDSSNNNTPNYPMSREEAIVIAAGNLEDDAAIICTTGMASRELFELRARTIRGHDSDFLTVGGMGHANQIALGLAIARPDRSVCCFDGDGAILMHMGSLAINGQSKCSNFLHLVFNNGVHGSVGGQPTVGFNIDIPAIAKACGYTNASCVKTPEDLKFEMSNAKSKHGPTLIEVRVRPGNRSDIGRPTTTPLENKIALMNFLKG